MMLVMMMMVMVMLSSRLRPKQVCHECACGLHTLVCLSSSHPVDGTLTTPTFRGMLRRAAHGLQDGELLAVQALAALPLREKRAGLLEAQLQAGRRQAPLQEEAEGIVPDALQGLQSPPAVACEEERTRCDVQEDACEWRPLGCSPDN